MLAIIVIQDSLLSSRLLSSFLQIAVICFFPGSPQLIYAKKFAGVCRKKSESVFQCFIVESACSLWYYGCITVSEDHDTAAAAAGSVARLIWLEPKVRLQLN